MAQSHRLVRLERLLGLRRGTANDDIVATYDLSAPYTNTTFNFYGTTCNATTGVTQDDFLSAQVSTVDDAHEAFGCQDAGEANGGSASALGRSTRPWRPSRICSTSWAV